MWKILLPEVQEVHLDFWFACACFSAFSMRETASKQSKWGMLIVFEVRRSPALVVLVLGFHMYVNGDTRCWSEGCIVCWDEHACIFILTSWRRCGIQSTNPVRVDLRPLALTSVSLLTHLYIWMSDNLRCPPPVSKCEFGATPPFKCRQREAEMWFSPMKKNEIKLFKWVFNYRDPGVNLIMNPLRLES